MKTPFTPWPTEFAQQYRDKGYWIDSPLTDLITKGEDADTAIICSGRAGLENQDLSRVFSYRELREKVSLLAYYFSNDLGLRAGDTALVQLPNIAEFYVVYFALMKVGVVSVNALFSHNERELRSYCEQIQPTVFVGSTAHKLFASPKFAAELKVLSTNLNHFLLVEPSDWADCIDDILVEILPEKDKAVAAIEALENERALKEVSENVAFFQLSGGSTGTPKLIPRTHNDYYFSIRRSAEICELSRATRYLCALPCAHNYPMSSPGAFGVFCAGGTVIMASSPEPQLCFDLIEKYHVSMASLVPPAAAMWVDAAESQSHNLESLRLIQVGGAKLSDSLARRIPEVLGCQLQQVLGMAEGLVNYTRLDDDIETIITTQGKPMCSLDEVKVVNEVGEEVPKGVAGELVTRGPYTIRGYFNAPEHNRTVFDEEGFYYSGDLVRQDERGYLTVVGRDKDQINRGGEKIAAEEVENLLLKHELIMHSALVSMPDKTMGEKSCAFIVPKVKAHPLKSVGLRKYLRTHGIADYKIPDRFEFIESLPLTHVGKPNKVALRQMISDRLSLEKASSRKGIV
ncbi:(2,3-dihydroxybenzoyl)adenylate synthase [Marinomonas mediterranea]|jgi:2,3-dihydroxybenzoate-AMP ligase|uniref:2,3-dihydroxybenzoate-AMP ligase n=1 Tax=Marinomonas mediterranea (strain ATCC 700492 / JCM 21426 / NBRC 103028 / MMB-1) TaxID=717774 RepID=F2JZU0_MARM1|nr:(2,3-dihydroxybenzoyl)adenylate synthase [Marinomonas mediterranea]ADZ92052.1 2,3-dihydroxybenzoate-AMP ligase [Marinomonas mediterranea MMB-1]WCN10018.1 (2,3-dihydroxybenzoyl)adenylate synthase [Marinomonas mediterranea]WCN14064.1 (2,3-dihydroxybenzoyl)adenylate synthase [Marinomonas mediterranea]WCN18124.1 (2,3-dihydroxybenzoyl)adenylate synthase [Marinomonas mediterranea MMB-1]